MITNVKRTQVQLTEDQAERLLEVARARGESVAEVIREAIDRLLSVRPTMTRAECLERAASVIGKYSGDGSPVSEDHDRYLDEAYSR